MPTAEMTLPEEFASTMQQLAAQAEAEGPGAAPAEPLKLSPELVALEKRLSGLEAAMASGFEKLTDALAKRDNVPPWQLERIDENLRALRNTESVNQRLFNSLHEELRGYRDNFLRDSLQKPVIRDLVVLFDDLSTLAASLQSGSSSKGGQGKVGQWRENLENTIHTLLEILHRLEVNEIELREKVDRALHRVVSCEPADCAEDDGRIVKRLKRGFIWHGQVLRAEEVVALRFRSGDAAGG